MALAVLSGSCHLREHYFRAYNHFGLNQLNRGYNKFCSCLHLYNSDLGISIHGKARWLLFISVDNIRHNASYYDHSFAYLLIRTIDKLQPRIKNLQWCIRALHDIISHYRSPSRYLSDDHPVPPLEERSLCNRFEKRGVDEHISDYGRGP